MNPVRLIKNPKVRFRSAVVIFFACIVFWPVSQFTFAKSEPPTILGLSWGAMILTALDIMASTDIRKEIADDGESEDKP